MYEFDEPYYEPTEADEILIKYTEEMKNALSKSTKRKIDSTEKENEKLKSENKNLRIQVNEIRNKERKLESEKRDLTSTVRKERLAELMVDFQVVYYKAYDFKKDKPKCNKCDDDRLLRYTTGRGEELTQNCFCRDRANFYAPSEHHCSEFRIDSQGKKLLAWYKMNRDSDHDWGSSDLLKEIWDDSIKYEDISKNWYIYFRTKEECQKYCDWLNREDK